jgi:hypothetical protein
MAARFPVSPAPRPPLQPPQGALSRQAASLPNPPGRARKALQVRIEDGNPRVRPRHSDRNIGVRHTHDGAGAVAAAMQIQESSGNIAAANDRPFAGHTVHIDGFEFHVVRCGPVGTDLVEAPSPFCPSERPGSGAEQRSNGVDLALAQGLSLRGERHPKL